MHFLVFLETGTKVLLFPLICPSDSKLVEGQERSPGAATHTPSRMFPSSPSQAMGSFSQVLIAHLGSGQGESTTRLLDSGVAVLILRSMWRSSGV